MVAYLQVVFKHKISKRDCARILRKQKLFSFTVYNEPHVRIVEVEESKKSKITKKLRAKPKVHSVTAL
jgi:hypothetical protein